MEALLLLVLLGAPVVLVLAGIIGIPLLIERGRQKSHAAFCFSHEYQYEPSRNGAEEQFADVVGLFNAGGSHK